MTYRAVLAGAGDDVVIERVPFEIQNWASVTRNLGNAPLLAGQEDFTLYTVEHVARILFM